MCAFFVIKWSDNQDLHGIMNLYIRLSCPWYKSRKNEASKGLAISNSVYSDSLPNCNTFIVSKQFYKFLILHIAGIRLKTKKILIGVFHWYLELPPLNAPNLAGDSFAPGRSLAVGAVWGRKNKVTLGQTGRTVIGLLTSGAASVLCIVQCTLCNTLYIIM